jgi:hypothetical protein
MINSPAATYFAGMVFAVRPVYASDAVFWMEFKQCVMDALQPSAF